MQPLIFRSQYDESINFVHTPESGVGFFESRYVRRCKEKVAMYVSIQSGCDQGCKMCHLTKTKQTKKEDVTKEGIRSQLQPIIDHYRTQEEADIVHINYMARGEPLDNPVVLSEILSEVSAIMRENGIKNYLQLISTIFPTTYFDYGVGLADIFGPNNVRVYYSFYSTDNKWRRRWFPKAADYDTALFMLKEYWHQGGDVRIHMPFIKGQNDSEENIRSIVETVQATGMNCDFNIVRYNDFDGTYEEAGLDHIEGMAEVIETYGMKTKMITRVGEDVAASCGMFYK